MTIVSSLKLLKIDRTPAFYIHQYGNCLKQKNLESPLLQLLIYLVATGATIFFYFSLFGATISQGRVSFKGNCLLCNVGIHHLVVKTTSEVHLGINCCKKS